MKPDSLLVAIASFLLVSSMGYAQKKPCDCEQYQLQVNLCKVRELAGQAYPDEKDCKVDIAKSFAQNPGWSDCEKCPKPKSKEPLREPVKKTTKTPKATSAKPSSPKPASRSTAPEAAPAESQPDEEDIEDSEDDLSPEDDASEEDASEEDASIDEPDDDGLDDSEDEGEEPEGFDDE